MLSRRDKPKADDRNSLPSRFRRFAKTPKGYALGALVLLTLLGGLAPLGPRGIAHAAAAVAAALFFDAAVARAMHRKIPFSVGGMITGLITADVLSPLTPLWVLVLTTFIALGSKHLLKRGRKPLFNPAAFGLLASILVFATAQSWWAAMPLRPLWELAVLFAAGIFVAVRAQKYTGILVFLGSYFLLLMAMAVLHLGLASATPADALRSPFLNSALFLGFFMLTDPPTSPATPRGQVQFGALSAVVAVGAYALTGGLAYLFIGTLAGNLWTVRLATARKPAARPGLERPSFLTPAVVGTVVGAVVVSAAVLAVSAAIHRGQTPFSSPLAAGSPASTTAHATAPVSQDGTWTGTVTQGFQSGAQVLNLSGTWNQQKLTLSLTGFSNEGEFVIQSGQVTLTTQQGAVWQGSIQHGSGSVLSANLAATGSTRRMAIQIGVPAFGNEGTSFTATVTAVVH